MQADVQAFLGTPIVLPIEIQRRGDSAESEWPRSSTVTTSDGTKVAGYVRWLHSIPRQFDDEVEESDSSAVRERAQLPLRTARWVESAYSFIEALPAPTIRQTQNHQAFLILDHTAIEQSGLLRVGESTVSVTVHQPPATPVSRNRLPFVPPSNIVKNSEEAAAGEAGQYWVKMPLNTIMESFRPRLIDPTNQSFINTSIVDLQSPLQDIVAAHNQMRFLLGVDRLQLISPSIAEALVESLIRTCRDGRLFFASWRCGANDLAVLERLLLEKPWSNRERDWASAILDWVEKQPPLHAWIESPQGSHVRFAIANLSGIEQEIALSWSSPTNQVNPLIISIPPQLVIRSQYIYPSAADERAHYELVMQRIDDQGDKIIQRIRLARDNAIVVPPGAMFGEARESLNLDTWQSGVQVRRPAQMQTGGSIRRIDDHWQLVIRASRDSSRHQNAVTSDVNLSTRAAAPIEQMLDLHELVGQESITLFIGSFAHPISVLTFTPAAKIRRWEGKEVPLDAVSVQSTIDEGWVVLFDIPDSWVQTSSENDRAFIECGVLRTFDAIPAVDCIPHPIVPWRMNPGRMQFDLSQWDPAPGN